LTTRAELGFAFYSSVVTFGVMLFAILFHSFGGSLTCGRENGCCRKLCNTTKDIGTVLFYGINIILALLCLIGGLILTISCGTTSCDQNQVVSIVAGCLEILAGLLCGVNSHLYDPKLVKNLSCSNC